ncbi:hypothetical protein ASPVEDRAFT_137870 [Aspergillus versicolor CBS 583.65]|uniref:Ent-kaurene synthase n=1 Tax=Aspergillus versicolor CBS 583.65 TaxID=1036611 RepID=A0A1L9PW90_ASPVE|nr:uncharacterized protein ASPVEDRAFT_137870 [Aspergillus versicolor CBS 583.65]OJJ05787.1 hypothetical protein ASPVEDRAFT_137870 [Aspergillus versicolor CBS 583.65]
MLRSNRLGDDARSLIQRSLQNYDDRYGFGTMSCAAYDTAWVSMVSKPVDGQKQWLFPECFENLLTTQSNEGGWSIGMRAQIDGILNTAAPLLALKRHAAEPLQLSHDTNDLASRIEKATASLRSQLAAWDVSTTDHVGFEIIVPAMLDLLEQEDPSLVFDFEAKTLLMEIHNAKMARFRPEYLYGPHRLTALHSLESFIGKIDFDKVRHHKVQGSMLGSPSSTAAYLMYSSQWDGESEDYLRHVVKYAAGAGTGGIPSAFPSTHFEASWVLSTLLRAGFSPADLESAELSKMKEFLKRAFENENGTLRFAPYFSPDVDDTAKTITSLNLLGEPVTPQKMVEMFDHEGHFLTYPGERDPSLTANCNAMMALLRQPDVSVYARQVVKIAKFVCDYWWKADGRIKDKWNTCYLYPSLLVVEALTDLLESIENGQLPDTFDQDTQSRIAVTLFQACFRALLDQQDDGSWNQSLEETAYGLLILTEARRLRFFDDLEAPLSDAIQRGVVFVSSIGDIPASYIWTEKVSYASTLLTESYLLAALKTAMSQPGSAVGSSLWNTPTARMKKHVELFHQAPLFKSLPKWELHGSMVEAALFHPLLRARKEQAFPRNDIEEDKYFDVIPLFWTSANNRVRTYASTWFLYEMTVIALLNFQVDEFMESAAGPAFQGRMQDLRQLIVKLLPDEEPRQNGHTNGTTTNGAGAEDPSYEMVYTQLSRFLKHVLHHPTVQSSSLWDQKILRRELRTYLLAHATQAEDSARLPQQQTSRSKSSETSTFFKWVRTISADHISCPYSFAFISCLLGTTSTPRGGGTDCFPTAQEKYLSAAVCRHLSTMCRMYNDLGSAERDRDEGNLNSIDFPEFGSHESIDGKKRELFELAEYERSCYEDAFKRLGNLTRAVAAKTRDGEAVRLAERRMAVWTMFCEQVDLYGQVYVIKDISSRIPN